MPASDIVTLRTSMGERAIGWLYALALILIALSVIFGIWRGVMIASRQPMTNPAAVSANTNPPANAMTGQAPAPQRGALARRPFSPGFRGPGRGRFFFMARRNPVQAGILMIIFTLIRGFVALMVVRILAELGLAILAMPGRIAVSDVNPRP